MTERKAKAVFGVAAGTPAIPSRLKIGPHTVLVSWDQEDWDRECDDEDAIGMSVYDRMVIFLKTSQADSQMRETLLHEALHFIARQSEVVDNVHAIWRVNGDTDEQFVRIATPWFLMLMRDNPALVAYCTHQDAEA